MASVVPIVTPAPFTLAYFGFHRNLRLSFNLGATGILSNLGLEFSSKQ